MAASDLAGALARTLQSLRAERGWSLDQLAARSGVSKGVLVALEQARSNPNLATLARIGDAFGVPVTLLVDVGGEPAVRISSPDVSRVLWRGPSGGTGTIIGATDPPWAVELWRWEAMPGEEFGGDAHAPATREMVWVESGTLTLTVAGERHAVGADFSHHGLGHFDGEAGVVFRRAAIFVSALVGLVGEELVHEIAIGTVDFDTIGAGFNSAPGGMGEVLHRVLHFRVG